MFYLYYGIDPIVLYLLNLHVAPVKYEIDTAIGNDTHRLTTEPV